MKIRTLPKSGRRPLSGLLALLTIAAAPTAQAFNYESFYGEPQTLDDGQDVKAIAYCPDKGSIMVGTRTNPDGTTEALATRITDTGTTIWQRAYRVAGSKQTSANAVVELVGGKGFALTGAVVQDPGSYIYVLQIGCEGNVNWATTLQNTKVDYRATGYDIIQSGAGSAGTPGTTAAAPAPGDLIVVGDEVVVPTSGASAGRIARLDLGGNVIWDQQYARTDVPFGVRFRAVTENVANSGAFTDLVVAGSTADKTTWASDRRALMFRTDANGTPLCNAILGNSGENDDFFGVTPIRASTYAGHSVLVGSTTPRGSTVTNGYLARFTAGNCVVQAQSQWLDPGRGNVTAYDAAEIVASDGTKGNIAADGTVVGTQTAGSAQTVGFLLTAQLSDLTQNTTLGSRLYGTQAPAPEFLYSMDVSGSRYVLGGGTFEDWEGVGDREDFYFVQTDPGLNTKCSINWKPEVPVVQLPSKRFTPRVGRLPEFTRVDVEVLDAEGDGICCKLDPPKDCQGVIDNGTVKLGVSDTGYLNVECDSGTVSSGRYGTTLVGLRLMSTDGDAASPGAPCEGWGVASADLGVSGYTSRCAGSTNVVVDAFSTSPSVGPSSAISVVHIGTTFRVTHQYDPILSVTPYLYRVLVTIENIGAVPVADLRYTRGIDYDVPPNEFSEYITIAGSASPGVLASNNNGFNSLDPLAANSGTPGDFTDLGPGDQGSHFDFALGTLKVGEKRTFVSYYGAAPDERSALTALGLVGAAVYSLGEADWDGLPTPAYPWSSGAGPGTWGAMTGEPNTFMYGVPRQQ